MPPKKPIKPKKLTKPKKRAFMVSEKKYSEMDKSNTGRARRFKSAPGVVFLPEKRKEQIGKVRGNVFYVKKKDRGRINDLPGIAIQRRFPNKQNVIGFYNRRKSAKEEQAKLSAELKKKQKKK